MQTLTYRYRPKPGAMLKAAGFFAACTAILAYAGRDSLSGPITATSVFYGALAAIAGLLALGAALGLYLSLTSRRAVILGPDSVTLPGYMFTPGTTTIPYAEIDSLGIAWINRHVFLYVRSKGRSPSIGRSLFDDNAAFDELCQQLSRRSGRRISQAGR